LLFIENIFAFLLKLPTGSISFKPQAAGLSELPNLGKTGSSLFFLIYYSSNDTKVTGTGKNIAVEGFCDRGWMGIIL
jgi:hypothetical protein